MRTNRDRLIERYINGRMSSSEQREFLDMAETDPNIRRILKAEQVISNAIARDRAALPVIAAEPSAQLLSRLAESNPITQQAFQPAPGNAAPVVGGTGSSGSLFFGSKIVQGLAAIAGTVGVVVTTLMIAPMLDSSDPAAAPAGRTERMETTAPAPRGIEQQQASPAPRQEAANGMSVTSTPETTKPADARLAPSATEPAETSVKPATAADAAPKMNPTENAASVRKNAPAIQEQEETPVIHSDSVHLKLNVD